MTLTANAFQDLHFATQIANGLLEVLPANVYQCVSVESHRKPVNGRWWEITSETEAKWNLAAGGGAACCR